MYRYDNQFPKMSILFESAEHARTFCSMGWSCLIIHPCGVPALQLILSNAASPLIPLAAPSRTPATALPAATLLLLPTTPHLLPTTTLLLPAASALLLPTAALLLPTSLLQVILCLLAGLWRLVKYRLRLVHAGR